MLPSPRVGISILIEGGADGAESMNTTSSRSITPINGVTLIEAF